MRIKITMCRHEKEINIQMDSEQRIKTTLKVLSENIQGLDSFDNIKEIRLKESGRRVDVECTYEEAQIYTGTELLI